MVSALSTAGTASKATHSPASGGVPVRLTTSPGIDVGGSYAPDGTKIVFESDRSGSQQIYVMNADGSGQQRSSQTHGAQCRFSPASPRPDDAGCQQHADRDQRKDRPGHSPVEGCPDAD